MYKSLAILVLLSAVYGQDTGGGDLESVLQQIFGKPGDNAGQVGTVAPVPRPSPTPSLGDKKGESSTLVPGVVSGNDDSDTSCTTDKGEEGECVRYYLCDVNNNTIITDGVGIIDIRLKDGPCPSYMDTCCLSPDRRPPEDPITPPPPTKEEQVQPFFATLNASQMEFGDSFNCSGFFSAPIWSGLFVVFIMLLITFYGIMNMMDIRTMDRFDDPKGKTITVNALE